MTIRAKLYAAIVLTILGPLATTVVALQWMSQLGDSFDEVREAAQDEALAREIKFSVTDMNGWQTAYGYDGGPRFRPPFIAAAQKLEGELTTAEETFTGPEEKSLVSQLRREFDAFMALDAVAWRELQAGNDAEVKRILLGPELIRFGFRTAPPILNKSPALRLSAGSSTLSANPEMPARFLGTETSLFRAVPFRWPFVGLH